MTTTWVVELAGVGITDADAVEAAFDASKRSWERGGWDRNEGRLHGTWHINVDDGVIAIHHAMIEWNQMFGSTVDDCRFVQLSATELGEHDRQLLEDMDRRGELISITEIARMLGVSHQRASVLSRTDPAFPPGEMVSGRMAYLKFMASLYVKQRHQAQRARRS